VLSSIALTFGFLFWAYRIQDTAPRLAQSIGIASFSLVFLGTAIAQLRTGFLWRNLSPGNRGLQRSDAPTRFILATVFHFLLAAVIIAFALWCYLHQA